jgi:hypothetical protein
LPNVAPHGIMRPMQIPSGIDVPELLARLQAFALGNDPAGMSDAQVAAALGLLDRVMPARIEASVSTSEGRGVSVKVTPE